MLNWRVVIRNTLKVRMEKGQVVSTKLAYVLYNPPLFEVSVETVEKKWALNKVCS
jgi:hypothetical protein